MPPWLHGQHHSKLHSHEATHELASPRGSPEVAFEEDFVEGRDGILDLLSSAPCLLLALSLGVSSSNRPSFSFHSRPFDRVNCFGSAFGISPLCSEDHCKRLFQPVGTFGFG